MIVEHATRTTGLAPPCRPADTDGDAGRACLHKAFITADERRDRFRWWEGLDRTVLAIRVPVDAMGAVQHEFTAPPGVMVERAAPRIARLTDEGRPPHFKADEPVPNRVSIASFYVPHRDERFQGLVTASLVERGASDGDIELRDGSGEGTDNDAAGGGQRLRWREHPQHGEMRVVLHAELKHRVRGGATVLTLLVPYMAALAYIGRLDSIGAWLWGFGWGSSCCDLAERVAENVGRPSGARLAGGRHPRRARRPPDASDELPPDDEIEDGGCTGAPASAAPSRHLLRRVLRNVRRLAHTS